MRSASFGSRSRAGFKKAGETTPTRYLRVPEPTYSAFSTRFMFDTRSRRPSLAASPPQVLFQQRALTARAPAAHRGDAASSRGVADPRFRLVRQYTYIYIYIYIYCIRQVRAPSRPRSPDTAPSAASSGCGMCIYIYIYIYTHIHIHICLYIIIIINIIITIITYVCMYVCVYIYIYVYVLYNMYNTTLLTKDKQQHQGNELHT